MNHKEKYMKMAIENAKKGLGKTKTNPLVGAVIVKDGKVVSQGYHRAYGEDHAEIMAIKNAKKEDLEGSNLYVNLEPCNHFGKTPPCTEAIIKSKIKNVYIGSIDPNPQVSTKGIERLRKNNIEVQSGILKEECDKVNKAFFTFIKKQRSYVILKTAMTLDGKIASYSGHSKWISSDESRKQVLELRSQVDGIMVGIGTILADDPRLNTRIENKEDPDRIVVDPRLDIPLDAKIFNIQTHARTFILCGPKRDHKKEELLKRMDKVEILVLDQKGRHLDLNMGLKLLADRNICTILLEGGGSLNFSMLDQGCVDYIYSFISPKLLGGKDAKTPVEGRGIENVNKALKLKYSNIKEIGGDLLVEADICLQE